MMWFGKDYGSPMQRDCRQTEVPIGSACLRCQEMIGPDEGGVVDAGGSVFHYSCFMRGIIGSVQHQEGRCSCGGACAVPDETVGLTIREEAELARACYEARTEDKQR